MPLNDFRMNWRFADPRYNVLPAEVLNRIKAFSPEAARQVSGPIYSLIDNFAIKSESFERLIQFDCSGEPVRTRAWLEQQFPEREQGVGISKQRHQ